MEELKPYNNIDSILVDLFQKQKYRDILVIVKEELSKNPNYAFGWKVLGSVFTVLNDHDTAIPYLKKSLELNPNDAETLNSLGSSLKYIGQIGEAKTCFIKAIEINPNYATAYKSLAIVFQDSGKLEEAQTYYRKAIELFPSYSDAHRSLSLLIKYDSETPHLKELEDNYNKASIISDKYNLAFALAKAHEDMKNYEVSFSYLEEANRLKFTDSGYNIDVDKELVNSIKTQFENRELEEKTVKDNEEEKKAIFIVGMPRSGTTLVEQILSSHSNVHGCGELVYLQNLYTKYINNNSLSLDVNRGLENLYKEYIEKIEKLNFSERIFVDKMPHNFLFIGPILEAFPNVKIINTQRDAMAVCWSLYKQSFFSQKLGFSYDFNTIAEFYSLYKSMMVFWNDKYPGRIYNLNYEKLTETPEDEIKNLIEYCELAWEEAVLNPHLNKKAVTTASNQQVRKKIYSGSSQAWKRYEKFLTPLQENLKSLGIL